MDLTEEEAQAVEQEIATREDAILSMIQSCAEGKPADVLATFGEEITRRLRDIVADRKEEVKYNLLQDPEEEQDDDGDLEESIEALLSMSEDEIKEVLENEELDDEEKEAVASLMLELMEQHKVESWGELRKALEKKE